MPNNPDHDHIPSKTLDRKLNWILFLQIVLIALIPALYVLGK